jgi:hypothetical protein
MKTEIKYLHESLKLAAEMVNKGLCEFTIHGGVYGTNVNHFGIYFHVPKWTREGSEFMMSVEITTDRVGKNPETIVLLETILRNGFESHPAYLEQKTKQIEAKKLQLKRLQKELANA